MKKQTKVLAFAGLFAMFSGAGLIAIFSGSAQAAGPVYSVNVVGFDKSPSDIVPSTFNMIANTFTGNSNLVNEVLAGQLAIAIENANLFAATEQAQAETAAYARRLTGASWDEFLNAVDRNERIGYTYDSETVSPLAKALPEAKAEQTTVFLRLSGN